MDRRLGLGGDERGGRKVNLDVKVNVNMNVKYQDRKFAQRENHPRYVLSSMNTEFT